MNIFAPDKDPYISAQLLPNKLVVKMPVESCQMLAHCAWDWFEIRLPKKNETEFYSLRGYINHPCTKWANRSKENLAWLIAHADGLCLEYNFRYGKIHACSTAISIVETMFKVEYGELCDHYINASDFVKAFTLQELKLIDDVHEAYRQYLVYKTARYK